MRIEVIPLDFQGQGALLEPIDQRLHDMAVDYCSRELEGGSEINLAKFAKVWIAVAMEGAEYQEVVGVTAFVWRIDVPLFRVTGENAVRATKQLSNRIHSYFQDQGARGQELFLHISSKERPEQRCPRWEESLKAEGAVPADRFSVKI